MTKPLSANQTANLERFKRASHGTWATAYHAGCDLSMMDTLVAKGVLTRRRVYHGDRLVHEFRVVEPVIN